MHKDETTKFSLWRNQNKHFYDTNRWFTNHDHASFHSFLWLVFAHFSWLKKGHLCDPEEQERQFKLKDVHRNSKFSHFVLNCIMGTSNDSHQLQVQRTIQFEEDRREISTAQRLFEIMEKIIEGSCFISNITDCWHLHVRKWVGGCKT